jgi:tRNA (adenine22-N1)-methyltransferase
MIKLSDRLQSIANMVDEGSCLVDIGCDHGFLDIYLVQSKKYIKVIASDVNKNALSNAIKNIKKYKLDDTIKTVLSNGLDSIDVDGLDTIVISGMGTHTIVGILYNNMKKLKNINTLIIQSNNDLDFLRYKVSKLGYKIVDEVLVSDANIIYTVIKFKKGFSFYTKKQLYFGPVLLKQKNDLFKKKNELELVKMEKFYPLIPKNHYHHKNKINWRIKNLKKILEK